MLKLKGFRFFIFLLFLISLPIVVVWAGEEFPSKTIEIVVPYGPGGGADITSRGVWEQAAKEMGFNVIFNFKPGGVATVGLAYVMDQPADGYTVYEASGSDIVLGEIFGRTKYSIEDLVYLGSPIFETSAIHTRTDSEWENIQQVIDYGKEHPKEKLPIAGADRLGIDEIFIMAVNKGMGIEGGLFKFVPFPSSGERHASVLGGHVGFLSDEVGDCAGKGRYENNQIRTLLINGKSRAEHVPFLKGVPCTEEIGIEIASFIGNWRTFAVKKGTPPEIIDYLRKAVKVGYESPSWQNRLEKNYMNLRAGETYQTGEECLQRLRLEKDRFTEILKEAGYIE